MESAITDYTDYCLLCGAKREAWHHCIPGNANRAKSDKYKLVVPLCESHHQGRMSVHRNAEMMMMSKIIGQLAFEKEYIASRAEGSLKDEAREAFRQQFGHSYL